MKDGAVCAMINLDLDVPIDWTRIDQVREAVAHSIAAVFGDRDLKDALAMVSAELLENAIKYGKSDQSGVRLTLRTQDGRLVLAVTNEIDEGSGSARVLHEIVRRVNAEESPLAAYEAEPVRAYHDEDMHSG